MKIIIYRYHVGNKHDNFMWISCFQSGGQGPIVGFRPSLKWALIKTSSRSQTSPLKMTILTCVCLHFVFREVCFTFLYWRGRYLRSSWKSDIWSYKGEASFGKPTAVWFANTMAANKPVPRQTRSAIRMWIHCDIVIDICTFHNYWQCVSHCQLQTNKITNKRC